MIDVGELASTVMPFLSAAAGAYGTAVVVRATDTALDASADATLGWGRRLVARFLTSGRSAEVEAALVDVAENPAGRPALYAEVKRALAEDPALAGEIAALLREAGAVPAGKFTVTVTGSTGVQVGDHGTQTINTHLPPR